MPIARIRWKHPSKSKTKISFHLWLHLTNNQLRTGEQTQAQTQMYHLIPYIAYLCSCFNHQFKMHTNLHCDIKLHLHSQRHTNTNPNEQIITTNHSSSTFTICTYLQYVLLVFLKYLWKSDLFPVILFDYMTLCVRTPSYFLVIY